MIGAGSAGLVSAYIGAAVKAKVTLVEKHKMGGDCLNFGCVPSKALIRSAKFLSHVKRSREFGVRSAAADFQFKDVMDRVHRVIRTVEPHDSAERYASLGVDVVQGEAKITSPWSVEIRRADGARQTLTTRSIIIAAGAAPVRAADPRHRGRRLRHLRHGVGAPRAAAAPDRPRRRADRLRARAVPSRASARR